jgi:RNA polymerase sigma-70 factor (ECF subfamily)
VADFPEPTDAGLVEAIRAGDPLAFETLYRRYREWVVSLAFRFCGNREDSLDVLQDTFAYILKKLPDLELRSQMKTFLYPAVKHLALSRKKAARRVVLLEEVPDSPAREEKPGEMPEMPEMLGGLPEGQREVLWLRFADGLDLKEIAAALEIPLGTVKSRLHNALEALRRRKKF